MWAGQTTTYCHGCKRSFPHCSHRCGDEAENEMEDWVRNYVRADSRRTNGTKDGQDSVMTIPQLTAMLAAWEEHVVSLPAAGQAPGAAPEETKR